MAVIPLEQPLQWGYDTVTKELVVRLRKASPDQDPDWVPDQEYIVRIPVASHIVNDLP